MKKMMIIAALLWFALCESAGARILDRPDIGVASIYQGKASYYGKRFHGRKTASGEKFDMYKLTAAHRKLALGTLVKVTNLENSKSVVVIINDRGPYVKGRMIDLSKGAAKQIAMVKRGIVKVKIEKLN